MFKINECGMEKYKDLEEYKPYNLKVPSKYCMHHPNSIFLNDENKCVNFINKNKKNSRAISNEFCPSNKEYEFGGICYENDDKSGDYIKATKQYKSIDGGCPEFPEKSDYIIEDRFGTELCIKPKEGVSISKCLNYYENQTDESNIEIENDCEIKPRLWEENKYCPSDLRFFNKSNFTCNQYQHPRYSVKNKKILVKSYEKKDKCKMYKYYDYRKRF